MADKDSWWTKPLVSRESPEWQKVLYGMTPWFAGGEYLSPQQMAGSPEFQLAGLGLGAGAVVPKLAQGVAPALTAAKGWLGGIPGWMGKHKAATAGLGVLGFLGLPNLFGGGEAAPPMAPPEIPPEIPTTDPDVPPSGLPPPGSDEYTGEPFGQPQIIEVDGDRFWWNPMGQGGRGNWEKLPSGGAAAGGLTPEQQMAMAESDRQSAMEQIRLQYQLAREQQGAGAAQDLTQMYAADPYKYWAQLGQMTPEAVARLTGGAQQPGEPFSPHPFSYPSAQWWGNLLPSEQQQIGGALGWMGINPQDWYSMYQRMIPGLGQRQVEPQWAR